MDGELEGLQAKLESLRAEIYRNLTPIQRAETGTSVPAGTATCPASPPPLDTGTSTLPTAPEPPTVEPPPPPPPPSNQLVQWPPGQNGWTIVLSSVPQSGGRAAAASEARRLSMPG